MKNFVLLFRGGLVQEKSPELWQNHMVKWKEWMDGLGQSGRLVGGQQLKQDGKVMRKDKNQIIDRPYAEAKEIVGGFLTLKANDQQEAIDIAKGCPIFEFDGTCEVAEIVN